MVGTAVNFTNLDVLDFEKGGGLLPAVVQHAGTDAVLMLGYMNREALVEGDHRESHLRRRRTLLPVAHREHVAGTTHPR